MLHFTKEDLKEKGKCNLGTKDPKDLQKSMSFYITARAQAPRSITHLSTRDGTTWPEKGMHRRVEEEEPP
jgi:hypothetical protein